MPGVSMMYRHPAPGNISEKVVVCIPCCGMVGDSAGLDIQFRQDSIDKGGFAYSGMSGEESYSPFKLFFYGVDAFTGFGGHLETRVTDSGVKIDKPVQIAKLVFVVSVCLIEYDIDGYSVCLADAKKRSMNVVEVSG